jgi:arylsulfatase A-like enzyme
MGRLATGLGVVVAAVVVAVASEPAEPARALVRPNIVLVVTDDQRVDELGPMTFPDNGQWTLFTDMAVNIPMCCPSRSTLLTGRYASETGVLTNSDGAKFDPSVTTGTRLQAAGYRTFLVGKYLNDYPWNRGASYRPPGWDVWQAVDYAGTNDSGYEVDWRFNRTFTFVRDQEADDSRPWFAAVNVGKPHLPSRPPARYSNAPVSLPPPSPSVRLTATQEQTVRSQRTARQRALMAVDEQMRNLIDVLRATGELDQTVILFVSDNGYFFGEHGLIGKAHHYDEAVLVPFAVRWPTTPGGVVTQQVQMVDLPVTITALAGAQALPGAHGTDLSAVFANPATQLSRTWVYVEGPRRSWQGVRSTRWKYAKDGAGEHLYDLTADPYEMTNLARVASRRAELDAARAALASLKP